MKRRIFRLLEFFFKNCMYPIVFFSVNTIVNASRDVYVHRSFKIASIVFAFFLIIFHILISVYLYRKGRLSYLNNFECISSFVFSLLIALNICIFSKTEVAWIIILALMLVAKDFSYLFLKHKFS